MNLIDNQTQIPRDKWRYGLRSSAATGCGWIAGYNALFLLGRPESPEDVLRWFTRYRPGINGLVGTTFGSMLAFFKRRGLSVTTSFRMARFNRLARESDACVFFLLLAAGMAYRCPLCGPDLHGRGVCGLQHLPEFRRT